MTDDMLWETMETPDGPFTVLADDEGTVLSAGWSSDPEVVIARVRPADRPDRARAGVSGVAPAVRAYYDGDLAAIDEVRVRHFGTELQRRGWAALRQIPAGTPLTYTEFAADLGSPSAVRAAAGICARNAPALFVPCHRVLRSDGTLGGFAWGVEVKRALLARESPGGAPGLFELM
ncbi:putative methylated-DNA:protein-cysteine methyltransferase [Microbacterium faecale]|uniref:Methylated-DNA:protein-cysteine methyltransferase n=1 Tax=Microbacterium faecale TaxID=1804630 RepID=A0A916Y2P9_9MICO|nr:methylated-DNA--[protein]-cysteine S-methyltransferase [Microbacterium faecale]GGD27848.1 putative methylated-DNA:protein-cysteine methyltransferase [Microbacterium faecale]